MNSHPLFWLCAGLVSTAQAATQPATPEQIEAQAAQIERQMAQIERQVELQLAQLEKQVEKQGTERAEQARQLGEQARRQAEQALEQAESARHWAWSMDDAMFAFAGAELGRERTVKGAPYCADALHESIQTLADGNRIVKKQGSRLCRDGEGRTRREVERAGGRKLVYLRDPVARESWVLDPERKSARRLGGAGIGWENPGAAGHWGPSEDWGQWARELGQRMRERFGHAAPVAQPATPRPGAAPAAPAAPKAPPAPEAGRPAPEPAVVIENEIVIKEGGGEPQRQRDVRVIRLSELPKGMAPLPPLPPTPPTPPALPGALLQWHAAPRGEGVLTALPAKEIEGLKVNGERTTWTIEAGKLGNEKPILITREVWTSPELMLTVHSRDFDPRRGESVYRLHNIRRGEPEAALMKLPPDYQQPPRAPRTPAPPDALKRP